MTSENPDNNVRNAWNRIDAWLAREHPSGAEILAPGASAAQVEQLAAQFGKAVPEALRASLLVHNGHAPTFPFDWFVHSCAYDCGGGTFKLLSIDEMLADWRRRSTALRMSDAKNAELAGCAAGVAAVFWNPTGWLPLASHDGECFFVDLEPADGGTVGQVVAWYRTEGAARVIAPDVEAWLETLAGCMESGVMYVDEEGVHHELE